MKHALELAAEILLQSGSRLLIQVININITKRLPSWVGIYVYIFYGVVSDVY